MQNICVTYIVYYILPDLCCVLSHSYLCMCPLLHVVSFICVIFSNTLQLFWVGTSSYNLSVSVCLPICVFSACKNPVFMLIFIFRACIRVCFPRFQCSCSCMSLFKRNCAWVCVCFKVCACFCVLVCVCVSGCVPAYYFVCLCCARMWVLRVRVHVRVCGMFERNFISSLFVCVYVCVSECVLIYSETCSQCLHLWHNWLPCILCDWLLWGVLCFVTMCPGIEERGRGTGCVR